jgi:hypothetical protein
MNRSASFGTMKKDLVYRFVQGLRTMMSEKLEWMLKQESYAPPQKNSILFLYPVVLFRHDTRLLYRCGFFLTDISAHDRIKSMFLN